MATAGPRGRRRVPPVRHAAGDPHERVDRLDRGGRDPEAHVRGRRAVGRQREAALTVHQAREHQRAVFFVGVVESEPSAWYHATVTPASRTENIGSPPATVPPAQARSLATSSRASLPLAWAAGRRQQAHRHHVATQHRDVSGVRPRSSAAFTSAPSSISNASISWSGVPARYPIPSGAAKAAWTAVCRFSNRERRRSRADGSSATRARTRADRPAPSRRRRGAARRARAAGRSPAGCASRRPSRSHRPHEGRRAVDVRARIEQHADALECPCAAARWSGVTLSPRSRAFGSAPRASNARTTSG